MEPAAFVGVLDVDSRTTLDRVDVLIQHARVPREVDQPRSAVRADRPVMGCHSHRLSTDAQRALVQSAAWPTRADRSAGVSSPARSATGTHLTPLGEVTGHRAQDIDHVDVPVRRAAALQTLAESDNLFGPRDVIPRGESQIAAIGHAWANARGADRAELIHIRSNFAEFCAWLYQDLGNHAAAQH